MRKSSVAGLALLMLVSTPASAPARLHIGTPAETRACISLKAIRAESAEDDSNLLFHVGGGRVFRNVLPTPCDDLRSINSIGKLRLKPTSDDELCSGDKVVVSGSGILGSVGLGSSNDDDRTCKLGGFEAITEMSVTEELRR